MRQAESRFFAPEHITELHAQSLERDAGQLLGEFKAVEEHRPSIECDDRLLIIGEGRPHRQLEIARQLAPTLGMRPGARVLRSDVIRKCLSGVAPETPLPPSAYAPDMSYRVYETIRRRAATALEAGYCVIIDAVSLTEEERRSFAVVVEDVQAPFSGIWLSAPAETMAARILNRHDDPSDASPEILQLQLQL